MEESCEEKAKRCMENEDENASWKIIRMSL